jgi:hypothetical protein
MVLVPFVTSVHPCAKQWSSLLIALSHRSFRRGSLINLSVVGDGFLHDRMHHPITVFFDVNERARILLVIFCKQGRDCVG